jgi:restriction system protein
MLPLLKILKNNKEYSNLELYKILCAEFNVTDEEKETLLSSGVKVMENRIGWSKTYLKKAKLLEYTKRGYSKITKLGLNALAENPQIINNKFLEKYSDFLEFKNLKNDSNNIIKDIVNENTDQTPDELIENGYNSIKADIKQELLDKLRVSTPDFFEKVILKLLEKMNYGKGEKTGRSGDGGVDGIIYQDKLGLDKIYLQAK